MKLATYSTVKNPSETKKGLEDKKAMRRAKNERLKEASSTKKNANISDEERLSLTYSYFDKKEEVDNENDEDVHRQIDTSLNAGPHRIQKQVSFATSTYEMEKKAKASSEENAIPKSASPSREEKPITENRNSSTHETLVTEMKVNLESFLGLLKGFCKEGCQEEELSGCCCSE
ncbi:hypothetical protein Peur_026782 [Populus x canadensis]